MLQWFLTFSEFAEFSESSALFRENLNVLVTTVFCIDNSVQTTTECLCAHEREKLVDFNFRKTDYTEIPHRVAY